MEPAQRIADAFLVELESVWETVFKGVGGVFAHRVDVVVDGDCEAFGVEDGCVEGVP